MCVPASFFELVQQGSTALLGISYSILNYIFNDFDLPLMYSFYNSAIYYLSLGHYGRAPTNSTTIRG